MREMSTDSEPEEIGAHESVGEASESSDPVPIKKHRGGRYNAEKSAVWDHFEFTADQKSKCHHCDYLTKDKNPSNLQKHLARKHPAALKDVESKIAKKRPPSASSTSTVKSSSLVGFSQSKLSQFTGEKKPKAYDKDSKKYIELMKALSMLFSSQSLPHRLVESPEFKYFIEILDPKFKLPNRRALSTEISKLYGELKDRIMDDLKDVKKFCVILDIWTKKGLSESYLAVLIKYFKPETREKKTALIALQKMEGSHTAENIMMILQSTLNDWNISEEQISFYVTDSGSNIVKALKECVVEFVPIIQQDDNDDETEELAPFASEANLDEFGLESESPDDPDEFGKNMDEETCADLDEFDKLEQDHNEIFGYAKRIPCIAHQLTCVVRKCIDQSKLLQPVIKAALRLVEAITKSTLKKELLLRYNNQKGLLSPSQTRWVYTYYVLERLLESKEAVEKVIVELNLDNVSLDPLKWKQIKMVRDLLKPFASAVNELEGDAYTTLSKVIPTLVHIIELMREQGTSGGTFGYVTSNLTAELEDRFAYILNSNSANFQPAYMIATFLDPEFMSGLLPEQRSICIRRIIGEITQGNANLNVDRSNETSQTIDESKQEKYGYFFKRAQDQQNLAATADDRSKTLKAKFEAYVEEMSHLGTGPSTSAKETSAFEFWASKQEIYGEISTYALNLLVVPASSAGIERVFSLAGIVQGRLRHRLGAGNTEKELMIRVNRNFLLQRLE